MSISQQEISYIESSFAKVEPIAEQAAALFYKRLFEIDPQVKPLFAKSDMKDQGRKLMQMLSVAVHSLNRLDQLVPQLEAMGARHVKYGVKREDYDTVGAALLWTLGQGLGEAFTPEVEAAWVKVYTLVAEVSTAKAYEN